MTMTRGAMLAMAMAVAMTGTTGVGFAQKGKPAPPNAAGSVTFADRATDEIVSNGGAYEGAIIYSSGTLYLDLAAVVGRKVSITLRDKGASAGYPTDHLDPGTYDSNGVFRIDNINALPGANGWGRSTGRIGFGTYLAKHALGFRYATANGVPVYGTEVCVRRLANVATATWQIASSEACSSGQGNAGLFEEGLNGKGYRFEAVYPVKFLATVTCTSACPQ